MASARRSVSGLGGPAANTAVGPLTTGPPSGVKPSDSLGSGGGSSGSIDHRLPRLARTHTRRRWEAAPSVVELARVAWLEERLLGGRVTGLDMTAAGEFRVELGAEQQRDVRDPQPHQEDDDAAHGAVGL